MTTPMHKQMRRRRAKQERDEAREALAMKNHFDAHRVLKPGEVVAVLDRVSAALEPSKSGLALACEAALEASRAQKSIAALEAKLAEANAAAAQHEADNEMAARNYDDLRAKLAALADAAERYMLGASQGTTAQPLFIAIAEAREVLP